MHPKSREFTHDFLPTTGPHVSSSRSGPSVAPAGRVTTAAVLVACHPLAIAITFVLPRFAALVT
ncbi:MAG TPA: hypothetical protein VN894_01920, partial [Polyangiaceae bacterium]|nr:hypothetical protein [Polyangiaceae bacterium]